MTSICFWCFILFPMPYISVRSFSVRSAAAKNLQECGCNNKHNGTKTGPQQQISCIFIPSHFSSTLTLSILHAKSCRLEKANDPLGEDVSIINLVIINKDWTDVYVTSLWICFFMVLAHVFPELMAGRKHTNTSSHRTAFLMIYYFANRRLPRKPLRERKNNTANETILLLRQVNL